MDLLRLLAIRKNIGMKKLIILFGLIFLCRFLLAQGTGKIIVEVTNVRSAKGVVLLSLFKGHTGFPSKAESAVSNAKVTITGNKAVMVFNKVPHGEYAVAVMHDEDGNGKMNTNMLGIPKEGYAASRNAKGSFGPPKYEDARFKLEGAEVKLDVLINY